MVLVQKWPVFQIFFLGHRGLENEYYDILERKNALLAYKKKRSSKSQQIDIFRKGLTHGFMSKNGHFSNFFF